MISWFDARSSEELGTSLARFYMERIPLAPARGKTPPSAARQKEVVEKMLSQLASFKSSNKLNIYKKAKLGNSFQWVLKEAGYPGEVIADLTRMLMVNL
ncbi:MAG: hypothetical protein PHU46_16715 [Rhodocyclaceae bacterium]|nr:hypothetical protein [Rhodocyclaceae bacterium]